MKNTLLIVDDHSIVRKGLKAWLEENSDWKVTMLTEASKDTLDFLSKTKDENLPEIIIFDVQLKDEMSFELIKSVSEQYPQIKGIVYSMFNTTGYILAAKESGAKGYVSKSLPEEELLKCLTLVQKGEEYFPLEEPEKITKAEQVMELLTKQQKRVFEEMLMGRSNEEIAKSMGLKLHSVEVYINRIYEKLGVFSREDILKFR